MSHTYEHIICPTVPGVLQGLLFHGHDIPEAFFRPVKDARLIYSSPAVVLSVATPINVVELALGTSQPCLNDLFAVIFIVIGADPENVWRLINLRNDEKMK